MSNELPKKIDWSRSPNDTEEQTRGLREIKNKINEIIEYLKDVVD